MTLDVFDRAWADAVCAVCDPVFESADVGFQRQVSHDPVTRHVVSLLWEADPARFAARYPDSGIIDSYGPEQWPGVHCIDYWVYVLHDRRQARISVEGWSTDPPDVDLSGDGARDGRVIGDIFARVLRVPAPSR